MQEAEKTDKRPTPKQDDVGFSALLVGLGTFSSRILGYLRDTMMMAFFSRTVTDAWLVAFRLPNFFRRLLGEGALSVSFIPVFVGLLGKGDSAEAREEARRLVFGVFTILLCILTPLTVLGIIFAEPAIRFLTPGDEYRLIVGKVDLTVHFARIMFSYIFLVSLYAYFMAILNALKKFLLPAFAPALWNIAMITSAFLPIEGARESGEVLAWAVIAGGIMQMGILIPPLVKAGYFPRVSFRWNTPSVVAVGRALAPSLLGLSVVQLTLLVNTRFASYLPEGANSWIFLADRILELPLSLFAVSLGTALLPTLSGFWQTDQKPLFHRTAGFYLRSVLFLAVPASVGLVVLAQPIVEMLFLHGKFTLADAEKTASVLRIYSLTVLTASVTRVLAPCFYAVKNTAYPAIVSVVTLVFHVILASVLVKPFGLEGLVFSTASSAALNMVLLFWGYQRKIGPFEFGVFFKSAAKFCVLGVLMALILKIYQPLYEWIGPGKLGRMLAIFFVAGLGGGLYMFMAHLWKLEEIGPTVDRVKRRLNRRRSS